MKKEAVWNPEINPDGISEPIENLSTDVWDRGYYLETDEGIWYEVYVNNQIKKGCEEINLDNHTQNETFGNFHDIMLDHYEDNNQITFFVPNNETQYTLDKLTDILI